MAPAHQRSGARSRGPERRSWRRGLRRSPRSPAATQTRRRPSAARQPATTWRTGSFDERHFVYFPEGGQSFEHSLDSRLTEKAHAFFACGLLDFRSWAFIENHLANAISQVEELADRLPSLVAGPVALDAPDAFVE